MLTHGITAWILAAVESSYATNGREATGAISQFWLDRARHRAFDTAIQISDFKAEIASAAESGVLPE